MVDDNDPNTEFRLETEKVMSSYQKNSQVNYIKHQHNMNGSAARNTGINAAKGKYITFLDDDDEYLPDKIKHQVKKMEELDLSWGACYTGYLKIGKSEFIQKSNETREGKLIVESLMRNLYVGSGSNLLFRKEVVDNVGGFDVSFKRNQDFEFLVRVCMKYKIAYVDRYDLKVHYEIRENRMSFDDIVNIDNHFINTFQSIINSLPKKDRKRIYNMVALNRFQISIKKKCLWKGIECLAKYNVGPVIFLRYCFYLTSRLITRSSHGFKY